MRFCLLSTFFPPQHFGGDAVFTAALANLLAEAGHHVEVVHCGDSFRLLQGKVATSTIDLHPGIKVHTLTSSWGPLAPFTAHCTGKDWLHARRLREILDAGFDVTHWHNASLLGAPQAFRWGSGVRLMTLHEFWLICPSHILFRNGKEVCNRRTCHSCTLHRGKPPQLWRSNGLISSGLQNIDRFLAPSRFVRQRVHAELPGLPIDVLPHFLPHFAPHAANREDFYFIAARLERAKGIHTVIPVFVSNGLPLYIAGAGEQEAELRHLAAGASNIHFLGRLPSSEMPTWYARARATIVPSVCLESFGLVILESLRHSTPVYVSNYGALPEIAGMAGGCTVFESPAHLAGLLGGEMPVQSDLSLFSPAVHLEQYLAIIEDARSRRRIAAHA
jgi:glycosyltransferase involved in cell wall biosynthesis